MKLKKIIPTLSVANVAESVKFYETVLGFSLDMCIGNDMDGIDTEIVEGEIYVHATVSRGGLSFTFLVDEHFRFEMPLMEECPRGGSVLFNVEVEDIAEMYDSLEGKAEIVKPLETMWYGMREFFIRDINGYLIGFSEPL